MAKIEEMNELGNAFTEKVLFMATLCADLC